MKFFKQNTLLFSLYLLLVVFLPKSPSQAQEKAYRLSPDKEIPLLTTGTLGTVSSLVLRVNQSPLDSMQIIELNRDHLLGFDLPATENYNQDARIASDVFLNVSYLFPLAPLLIKDARQEFGIISVMLLETILLNETFTGLSKVLVSRPRPFTHNADVPFEERIQEDNNLSFFSGHTSYTAALSFFSAQVLSQYIDNPTTRKVIWAGAIAWPAATGYFRYAAGKHYITDILTGYVIGAALGYFIPRLHETTKGKNLETNTKGFHLDPQASQMFKLVFVF
ncbi:membrane-associated phospholipid phosphatase [Catalinimonas alkaloidigena]|uniref:phosphatase PAP2 family protein n=1 Tax=Catalinimonas alkaloidigena TaxID=1075417 RepID=UPI0024058FC7|nr:phosphatase PAP2 family protein [Catalinimonas alkaloidigena]MDF9795787.1 membrane-associated phospholipid phosphatase [Catalinimonas alkaloidigena]